MDAIGLILNLSTGTYTVTRRTNGGYDAHGRSVAGVVSNFTIVASVQAPDGKDLMRLPEGRRISEMRVIFTATPLLSGGQAEANEADVVAIDGASYEVQEVQIWHPNPGSDPAFCRCIGQLITS